MTELGWKRRCCPVSSVALPISQATSRANVAISSRFFASFADSL